MSVSRTLLGLLEPSAQHGYVLRQRYDTWFGSERALKSAQVYSSLHRLVRDGYADLAGVVSGEGPERRIYAITESGVLEVERWLAEPEVPDIASSRRVLFGKVVVALESGRSAVELLDRQRQAHLARMREMRARRQSGDVLVQVDADFELYHLDADLKWMDGTQARLKQLAALVHAGTAG